MIKATLDTNVLVSGTFWEGEAFKVMQLVEHKKVQCFLSSRILKEYDKVMHSAGILEKAERKGLAAKSSVIKLIEMCELVDPNRVINAVKEDPEDNKILECAVAARSDYIVTYDRHLLKLGGFEGVKIVSPTEFLRAF